MAYPRQAWHDAAHYSTPPAPRYLGIVHLANVDPRSRGAGAKDPKVGSLWLAGV